MSSSTPPPPFPVRLISLPKTLARQGCICFTPATGWDFHIISHTWSQDLELWSSKIGRLLRLSTSSLPFEPASVAKVDSYSKLFESQDFCNDQGYDLFVDFLRILRADGVENVWFDALCINQEDVEEKSREIKHMGSFYSRSLACYAWTHGVGRGFSLWGAKEGQACLPRWFSRVWTFQELLLPKNLIFVAELQKDERQMLINSVTCFKAYSVMNHKMTYCCTRDARHIVMGSRSRDQGVCTRDNREKIAISLPGDIQPLASVQVDAGSLVKGVFICDECGSEVGDSRQFVGSVMCLVERAAYLDLMLRAGRQLIGREDEETLLRLNSLVRQAHGFPDDLAILRVHRLLEKQACDEKTPTLKLLAPQVVLGEISERECFYDEDRVLSILGLLGVEEIAPVRAGRSLGEQVQELAMALLQTGQTELLLKLCSAPFMSDYEPDAGMSWVPPFKAPSSLRTQYRDAFLEVCTNLSYQPQAQVQSLTASGLTLSCHVFEAKLVSLVSSSTELTSSSSSSSPLPTHGLRLPHDPNTTYPLLSHFSSEQLFLTPPQDCIADLMAGLLLQAKGMDSICRSPTNFSFHLWLLLLASYSDEVNMFMACAGDGINRLHKVGSIIMPQEPRFKMAEKERRACTIAGFGKYLPTNLWRNRRL